MWYVITFTLHSEKHIKICFVVFAKFNIVLTGLFFYAARCILSYCQASSIAHQLHSVVEY